MKPATPRIQEQLNNKIMILDGAMGTLIQQAHLTAQDFGGEEYEGCNEILNITRPDLIRSIHEEYLAAGADIIETNTFGATDVVLAEYALQDKTEEINLAAATIAREAADQYATPDWPRYVAGSVGPTTKSLSVTGGITFDQLTQSYYRQALALISGGVDVLLIETAQDTLNVKAAGIGIQRALDETGKDVPIMISGTIEPMGTTLAGQNIEAFYISLEHLHPISIGLNCATGPEFMRDHIRTLSNLAQTGISCYPNAGLPDENGHYHETPAGLATKMAEFARQGWLNLVGGCCGTTPEHIRHLAEEMKKYKPRQAMPKRLPSISGIEPVYVEADNRPLLVGERTNVIGSKKFRNLIREGKYEEASEIARTQVKGGAQIIDICLADPERDERTDMEKFLQFAIKKVKAPLMIDTTDPVVAESALKYSQGKSIINSINLEEGEKKFEEVVSLVRKYGAAVVIGTIDEKGMAITRERKLEIAERSFDLLVHKYGMNPKDMVFDPLVFPVGTGDQAYIGSALETVEGIRLIKESFPDCQTILGISNVSFGLPPAGREVLNAVFLYHCTKAGLDYAIVNTEKLERYASIPPEERQMAEDLLFRTNTDTLNRFTHYYREKKVTSTQKKSSMSLEERLVNYVVEGMKEGLTEDLQQALKKSSPLDIINGPLMKGMEKVGQLFNDNQLIVAEVLQSAEVMKAAVSFLQPYMEKSDNKGKGKIILATVKGDVHDIGKNLVEIILSNNGFQIVDLGIKVPSEQIIKVVEEEKPDMIGLSGLLVKSAQQMVLTAQDLKMSGIDIPLLVGGAALTKRFTETKIAPEYNGTVLYARDAMEGLQLANRLVDSMKRDHGLIEQKKEESERALSLEFSKDDESRGGAYQVITRSPDVNHQSPVYPPPDFKRHVLRNYPISHVQPYLNLQMLLGKHLGLRGSVEKLLTKGDKKAVELREIVFRLLEEAKRDQLIRLHGIYQFFPAQSSGNQILIYAPQDLSTIIQQFTFPRQRIHPHLCLADFLRSKESGVMDYVAFMAVTAGEGIRELAGSWKDKGDYLRSHVLQALALELAEAFAERLHHLIRDSWGIPDSPEMTMKERFSAKYQGIRVSFGYPACPNLNDQEKLFQLIQPEAIGISLTDGFMMEPEASVSAMVFSHPDARYFSVE
ncbi:methionine synthase [Microaerobacter geothermalis]|uniref:methionine synthase n=1 Tax=Microaerobacter geothermalis TaxID=674972 RepID=UPI001F3766F4|nr:methionine synthase [Microaerobacter geothermalis]MCF6094223.1 methionine synthase [Microaerobacter geothermalis]